MSFRQQFWERSFRSLSHPVWPVSRSRSVFLGSVIIGVIVWLFYSLFFKEAGLLLLLNLLLFWAWGWVIYLLLAVVASIKIIRECSWQLWGLTLAATIVSVALFSLPLLFWATGKVPSYQFAMVFSILMASLPIGYVFQYATSRIRA